MNEPTETRAPWRGSGRLQQLHDELERQVETRIDAVIDTRQILATVKDGALALAGVHGTQATELLCPRGVPLRTKALQQLCEKMDPSIPGGFGRILGEQRPERCADLLNGLMADSPRRLFIRQLDDQIRAVLSDRYRVVDNFDLMLQALQAAEKHGAMPLQASVTDDHMRITLIAPALWQALNSPAKPFGSFFSAGDLANPEWRAKRGLEDNPVFDASGPDDGAHCAWPGCDITNSETGSGATRVSFNVIDKACFNLTVCSTVQREVHLGRQLEEGIFRAETLRADDRVKVMCLGDSVEHCFKPETLRKWLSQREKAAHDIIQAPTMAVENVATACDLSEDQRNSLLERFLGQYSSDGQPNRDGLSQALARMAQDASDPDTAAELAAHSGAVISDRSIVAAALA